MLEFQQTVLWKTTLAEQDGEDPHSEQRERLRAAYMEFRKHACTLAAEISRELPDFTVHDISHLDALWETADMIAGEDYSINPVEAFVLGGSFLIHDLGLGLAAYPGGLAEVMANEMWTDTVSALLHQKLGRGPRAVEIQEADAEIQREATTRVLREQHASCCETLASRSWDQDGTDKRYYLIENTDLRTTFSSLIGRLGHSHWWPVIRLQAEFGQIIGAPADCPGDWTLDPLKLACLLRVADASHLHAGRAPGFLRSIRQPAEGSVDYWVFQEKLQRPRVEGDRLVFTVSQAFGQDEADAWWLCSDALKMVDSELRNVDALLADTGRSRFRIRFVAGCEDAARLATFVSTDGWTPVDTQIRVSDVATLVEKLGGTALYGRNDQVALRELVQNATDAVRARRLIEGLEADWGKVTVRLLRQKGEYWLEVEDNGIGMSADVLCGPFLDFGTSYWGSSLMQQELPGLMSRGFSSTGKYGIGFFSVFMLGDHVEVITRRPEEARADTRVLIFSRGVERRPLLRDARADEQLGEGGSCVRVKLKHDPARRRGMLFTPEAGEAVSLAKLCGKLCPAIDANLETSEYGEAVDVVGASDWTSISSRILIARIAGVDEDELVQEELEVAAKNLQLLRDEEGAVVGRATISRIGGTGRSYGHFRFGRGVVVSGGLSCGSISSLTGVLVGEPVRASRDSAVPSVSRDELRRWASAQAKCLNGGATEARRRYTDAAIVRRFGAYTELLTIAESSSGLHGAADTVEWARSLEKVCVVDEYVIEGFRSAGLEVALLDGVLVTEISSISFTDSLGPYWPPQRLESDTTAWAYLYESLLGAVVDCLAAAWSVPVGEVAKTSNVLEEDKGEVQIATNKGDPVYDNDVYVFDRPG